MMHLRLLVLSITAAVLAGPAIADDSAIERVGGTLRPMSEHPTVRMVKERVAIVIHPDFADVACEFVLLNEGPATAVEMGFPDNSGGDVSGDDTFEFLRSWVDEVEVPMSVSKPDRGDSEIMRWWTKRVEFAADSRRVVRVVYRGGIGSVSDGGRFFTYLLWTGASWNGPIGRVHVQVTWADFVPHFVSAHPEPTIRSDQSLTWIRFDAEPFRGGDFDQISLGW
jgi:hypothetical protein